MIRPAGPKGAPLIGSLIPARKDLLAFFGEMKKYGDITSFKVLNFDCALLSHPDPIEEVLVKKQDSFVKPYDLRQLMFLLGEGLLTNEGKPWLRRRKLIQPAFHMARIQKYTEVMKEETLRAVSSWKSGETRDVHRDMMKLTLRIVAKCLFSTDVGNLEKLIEDVLEQTTHQFNQFLTTLFPVTMGTPTPGNVRLWMKVRELNRELLALIARRRHEMNESNEGDLLSVLISAREEGTGESLTDAEIRDEVMTLLMAGHETTAIALSWVFYMVAQHPQVDALLQQEWLEKLGSKAAPDFDDLKNLPYTKAVIQETMRLYPPAWAMGREVAKDVTVGGYPFKKGSQIYIAQWFMHRDERFFEEPLLFKPERFLGESEKKIPKFAYFPFGGGPRVCIGNAFAMAEAAVILAGVLKGHRMKLDPAHPVEPWPVITLRPRFGIRVTWNDRPILN